MIIILKFLVIMLFVIMLCNLFVKFLQVIDINYKVGDKVLIELDNGLIKEGVVIDSTSSHVLVNINGVKTLVHFKQCRYVSL